MFAGTLSRMKKTYIYIYDLQPNVCLYDFEMVTRLIHIRNG